MSFLQWPFVRRSVYEFDCNYLRAKIDSEREINAVLRNELIETRAETRDANGLVKALLQPLLRVKESAAPLPKPEPSEDEKKWAEVRRIAREQSFGDIQLHAHLTTYANQLRREGKSADEVAGKLVQWQTSELAAEDHT